MLQRLHLAHSPARHLFAFLIGSHAVRLWRLPSTRLYHTGEPATDLPYCLELSTGHAGLMGVTFIDEDLLLCAHTSGALQAWRIRDGSAGRGEPRAPSTKLGSGVVWSQPEQSAPIEHHGAGLTAQLEWEIQLPAQPHCWDCRARPGKMQAVIGCSGGEVFWVEYQRGKITARQLGMARSGVVLARLSRDGESAATASRGRQIAIWRPRHTQQDRHRPWRAFDESRSEVWAMAFSSSGRHLVSGGIDNGVYLWDLRAERALRTMRFDHDGWISDLDWSSDDRLIACASWDNTIGLFGAAELTPIVRFEMHEDYASQCLFLPGTPYLVSASYDRRIGVWDVREARLVRELRAHDDWVQSLQWLGEDLFASASSDRQIRIWSARTFEAEIMLGDRGINAGWMDDASVAEDLDSDWRGSHNSGGFATVRSHESGQEVDRAVKLALRASRGQGLGQEVSAFFDDTSMDQMGPMAAPAAATRSLFIEQDLDAPSEHKVSPSDAASLFDEESSAPELASPPAVVDEDRTFSFRSASLATGRLTAPSAASRDGADPVSALSEPSLAEDHAATARSLSSSSSPPWSPFEAAATLGTEASSDTGNGSSLVEPERLDESDVEEQEADTTEALDWSSSLAQDHEPTEDSAGDAVSDLSFFSSPLHDEASHGRREREDAHGPSLAHASSAPGDEGAPEEGALQGERETAPAPIEAPISQRTAPFASLDDDLPEPIMDDGPISSPSLGQEDSAPRTQAIAAPDSYTMRLAGLEWGDLLDVDNLGDAFIDSLLDEEPSEPLDDLAYRPTVKGQSLQEIAREAPSVPDEQSTSSDEGIPDEAPDEERVDEVIEEPIVEEPPSEALVAFIRAQDLLARAESEPADPSPGESGDLSEQDRSEFDVSAMFGMDDEPPPPSSHSLADSHTFAAEIEGLIIGSALIELSKVEDKPLSEGSDEASAPLSKQGDDPPASALHAFSTLDPHAEGPTKERSRDDALAQIEALALASEADDNTGEESAAPRMSAFDADSSVITQEDSLSSISGPVVSQAMRQTSMGFDYDPTRRAASIDQLFAINWSMDAQDTGSDASMASSVAEHIASEPSEPEWVTQTSSSGEESGTSEEDTDMGHRRADWGHVPHFSEAESEVDQDEPQESGDVTHFGHCFSEDRAEVPAPMLFGTSSSGSSEEDEPSQLGESTRPRHAPRPDAPSSPSPSQAAYLEAGAQYPSQRPLMMGDLTELSDEQGLSEKTPTVAEHNAEIIEGERQRHAAFAEERSDATPAPFRPASGSTVMGLGPEEFGPRPSTQTHGKPSPASPPAAPASLPLIHSDAFPTVEEPLSQPELIDGTPSLFDMNVAEMWQMRVMETRQEMKILKRRQNNLSSWRAWTSIELDMGRIFSVVHNRDIGYFAAAGARRHVEVWSLNGGRIYKLPGRGRVVYAMAATPDGRVILAGDDKAAIHAFLLPATLDAMETSAVGRCSLLGHVAPISTLAVNSTGKLLLSGSLDGTARLWSLEDGACVAILEHGGEPISGVDFSNKGPVTISHQGTLRLWDRRGIQIDLLEGFTSLTSLACRRSSIYVTTANGEVYHYQRGRAQRIGAHAGEANGVAVNADNMVVTVGGDGVVSLQRGEEERRLQVGYELSCVDLGEDIMYVGTRRGAVEVFRPIGAHH